MRIDNISNLGLTATVEYFGQVEVYHASFVECDTHKNGAATGLGRLPRQRRSLTRGRTASNFDRYECIYIYISHVHSIYIYILSIYLIIYSFIYLFADLFIYLSIYLLVYLSIYSFISIYIYLLILLFFYLYNISQFFCHPDLESNGDLLKG